MVFRGSEWRREGIIDLIRMKQRLLAQPLLLNRPTGLNAVNRGNADPRSVLWMPAAFGRAFRALLLNGEGSVLFGA